MQLSKNRSRRRSRALIGLWAEGLEPRHLLVATPINVATGAIFAIASPLPGLASSAGGSVTSQALASTSASVAPASSTSAAPAASFGPSATGPSTTLSPLMNDAETAVATASEVARPTPGRSDRISTVIEKAPIVPLPHLRPPEFVAVIPGPAVQPSPPAPMVEGPAPNLAPPPSVPEAPAPAPVPVPEPVLVPMALDAWDVALERVAAEPIEAASLAPREAGVLAGGVLLVAWGGWKIQTRTEGQSRRRPLAVSLPQD